MSELNVSVEPFGTVEGVPVERYRLRNKNQIEICILTLGGAIQSITTPDRNDQLANIALGFATLDEYVALNKAVFFGVITGRYANRIANGRFTLDGKSYQLTANNGPNHLHGGPDGFDKRIWLGTAIQEPNAAGVKLTLVSPDGDQGFPGELSVQVSYRLNDTDELRIDYSAITDRPTILNLTNHSYFNLAGEGSGSILGHAMTLNAGAYLPTDSVGIPTGGITSVDGTPFDFRHSTPIGARIRDGHEQIRHGRGYDHNFILDRSGVAADGLAPVAAVYEPTSGRVLEVKSTEPGVQFYTGGYLDGTLAGPSGRTYRQGDGFALETQHYPDSPNHPEFPTTVLRPGETFQSTTTFTFSVQD